MKQTSIARFDAVALWQFGASLLAASGLTEDRARDVADVLLEADLLGHTTHGFVLLPAYLKALKENSMEKTGEPQVVADHDSALTWDGRYLPGPWLVRRAIAEAQARTMKHPVVTVVIRQSHHIGCLQAYLRPVTETGNIVLLSCSDPAIPHRHAARRHDSALEFKSNRRRYSDCGDPILIDISTSTTSNGRCQRLAETE